MIFCCLLMFSWTAAAETVLIADGKSDYAIVIAKNAFITEKTAATELQNYLQTMSGVKLPVIEDENYAGKAILLGQTPRIAKLLALDFSRLKTDEIIQRSCGNDLILSGDRQCGTLYAVYEFLERQGMRWWTKNEKEIPRLKTISFGDLNVRYAPPFIGRDRLGGVGGTFAAWQRVNGHFLGIPESHGGVLKLLGWCHTNNQMIPYAQYLKSNPDYFALVNGKRGGDIVPGDGCPQLCYSNPEVRKLLTAKTLEWLKKEKNPRMISVSQNDCWNKMANNYCRCDQCRAVMETEGSPAGPLLSAVNEVAAAVKKEYPGVMVETLAYQFTVKPPLHLRPADNVIVRFCAAKNALYPWNSDENAKARDEFLAWRDKADAIFVWNYTANFSNLLMPHPSLQTYAADLRFMAENHVVAVLEQGYGQGLIGDLTPLHNYVTCKLMWDPYRDPDTVIREFLEGYYGAAAPELRKYIDAERDLFGRLKLPAGYPKAAQAVQIPAAEYLKLKTIFDRAEALVAGDPVRLLRVRTAALAVNFPLLLCPDADARKQNTPEGRELRRQIDLEALMKVTRETYKSLNVRETYREATEATVDRLIDDAAGHITGNWNTGKKIPDLFKDIPAADLRVYAPGDFSVWNSKCSVADGFPVIEMDSKKGWKVHFGFDATRGLEDSDWLVLAGLRTDANGNSDSTAAVEISSTHFPTRNIRVADIAGPEFKYVNLGVYQLNGTRGYIALSPSGIDQKLQMQYLVLIRNGYHFGLETPAVCKSLPPENWRSIPAGLFNFWDKEKISVKSDAGNRIVVSSSSQQGAVQCCLPVLPGKWKVLLTLRADGPAQGAAAVIWTKSAKLKNLSLSQIGGNSYREVEYAVMELKEPNNLLTITRVYPATTLYLKNIILIRQGN